MQKNEGAKPPHLVLSSYDYIAAAIIVTTGRPRTRNTVPTVANKNSLYIAIESLCLRM
jgi:hypothetical protein